MYRTIIAVSLVAVAGCSNHGATKTPASGNGSAHGTVPPAGRSSNPDSPTPPAAAKSGSDAKGEQANELDGTWKIVEVDLGGEKIKNPDDTWVVIKGSKYIERSKDVVTQKLSDVEMICKLNESARPRIMELYLNGKLMESVIYEADGAKLKTARLVPKKPADSEPPLPKGFLNDDPKYTLNIRYYEKQ